MRTICTDCGSSDGLAQYESYTYCFSCDKRRSSFITQVKKPSTILLPENTKELNDLSIEFLSSCFIEEEEALKWNIFWSPKYNRLCFPYYVPMGHDSNLQMVMCWMRDLSGTSKAKWLFSKDPTTEYSWLLNKFPINKSLVLVEDVISGIRVSKYLPTAVLGSTHISKNSSLHQLLDLFETVVLFLDGDIAGQKAKIKLRNELKLTHNVILMRNTKDPKRYNDKELLEILQDSSVTV